MKVSILFIISTVLCINIARSQVVQDSSSLREVIVKAYFSEQPLLRIPASISVINSTTLGNQSPASLVPAFNTVPGVRMEERSPGSYRLSLRGSLLRSPFGIRNVKMYMDDFLLTDAGGNTYLNLLDVGSAAKIEILKGPEGSIFGANSGGVILINTQNQRDTNAISAGLNGGSYGLFHENIHVRQQTQNLTLNVNQAFQRSDGYRENSSLKRSYVHVTSDWKYRTRASLKALALLSDLNYQTPGGLTAIQYGNNPRAARPGTATAPGAVQQQAQIFNQTFLAGLSHELKFSDRLRHVIAFTVSHTDFKNPFITNYETRDEASAGIRTYAELKAADLNTWSFQAGGEAQQTSLDVDRFENNHGSRGTLLSSDFLKASQGFLFARLSVNPVKNLSLESALSLNKYQYNYESYYPSAISAKKRRFATELMPRFAASYIINPGIALRASISRGYSPPTLEEVNPSVTSVNTTLQAEKGWNRELGMRISLFNSRLYWDAVFFYFSLNDAIVREVEENDIIYYINAGGTRQKGFESELVFQVLPYNENRFLKNLEFKSSYTYSQFKFINYINDGNNFSGNRLTGVPKHILVSSLNFQFLNNLSFYAQHNFTSSLPLNDANTTYAERYHLITARASWSKIINRVRLTGFVGADNLLNENYSLGNDLNAFGGRYFNAALPRNFYAGLSFSRK